MRFDLITEENWIAELPDEACKAMLDRMTFRELAPGKDIIKAGNAPRNMVQITSGYVRLSGLQVDGRRSLITIFGPGNSYGETAIVSNRDFNHTSTTMTAVKIGELLTSDFWELYHRFPAIPEALCRKFARAITRQMIGRDLRAEHRLGDRIAMLFDNLAARCGDVQGESLVIRIPFSQNDIAGLFDVTRQSVQREISGLKRAGLLRKDGSIWIIPLKNRMNNIVSSAL